MPVVNTGWHTPVLEWISTENNHVKNVHSLFLRQVAVERNSLKDFLRVCNKCTAFYFPSENSAVCIVSNFEIFLEEIFTCVHFVSEQSRSGLLHVPECQTCGCLGFVYFTNPHTCGIKKENHQIPKIRVRKQRNNVTNMIGTVLFIYLLPML